MNLLSSGINRKIEPIRTVRNQVGRLIEIQKLSNKFLSLSLLFICGCDGMVDKTDLKSVGAIRAGSSPVTRTKITLKERIYHEKARVFGFKETTSKGG